MSAVGSVDLIDLGTPALDLITHYVQCIGIGVHMCRRLLENSTTVYPYIHRLRWMGPTANGSIVKKPTTSYVGSHIWLWNNKYSKFSIKIS